MPVARLSTANQFQPPACLPLLYLGSERPPNPDALQFAALEVGVLTAAMARAKPLGRAVPGPPTDDTRFAFSGCPSRAVRRGSQITFVIAILEPIRNVA